MDTIPYSIPLQPTLPPVRILKSLIGFSALGLCAAIGSPDGNPMEGLQVALLPVAGATVLTVPALLVAHQTLALKADPREILKVVGRTLCDGGELALALLPVAGLFLMTTNIMPQIFVLLQFGIGMLCLETGVLRMIRAEREQNPGGQISALILALGWAGLAGMIALRLFIHPFLQLL